MSNRVAETNIPSARRIAGFSCYQGFVFALFYMGANRGLSLGPIVVERADLLCTLLCALAMLLAMIRFPRVADRLLESDAALATCAFMLMAGAFVPSVLMPSSFPGLAAEGFLVGAPMATLLGAWGRVLGLSSPRVAACEIFASTALAGAVCFAASAFGPDASVALTIACPAASVGMLLVTGAGRPAPAYADSLPTSNALRQDPTPSHHARALSKRMLAGAVLYGMAAGLMEAYRSDPGTLTTPTLPATLLILALFCVAVLQSLLARKSHEKDPLGHTYRIVMLVTMVGFLFAPVLQGSGVPGEAIVLAGYLGLTATYLALFIAASALAGLDSSHMFRRGFAALYAGEVLGIAASNAFDFFSPISWAPYAMLAFAGLATLISYLFLFTEADFKELSAVVDAVDPVKAMHAAIVESAKLSQREAEVLILALKGRTNERIAQELCIAKSTADTHLRRIYAKANVHSRQELLDYGERLVK